MRYRDWSIQDFTQGYIDRLNDNLIPDNAARDCQNFISKVVGSLQKRGGQSRFHTNDLTTPIRGLHAFYEGELVSMDRKLVCVSGGQAYYYQSDQLLPNYGEMVKIQIGGEDMTLNANLPVYFATFLAEKTVDTHTPHALAFSGVDHPWKWDGESDAVELDITDTEIITSRYPAVYKEKLFVVSVYEPSVLRWSESFQIEGVDAWTPVNYWKIKDGDGDVITGILPSFDELFIFKNRSMHILRGSHISDFRLFEVEDRIGCVSQRAMKRYKRDVYFVGYDGIYIYDGSKAVNLSQISIPGLWDNINHEYLYKAAVGVWNDILWFALPEGSSTVNNLVVAYVPRNEGVGSFWPLRGVNVEMFEQYDDKFTFKFLGGSSIHGYVNELETGVTDFDAPITAYWEGKQFDAGSPEREKKSRKAFVQDTANDPVNLQISVDGGAFNSLTAMTNDRLVREYKFDSGRQWRNIVPKLIHSAADECEVRGILIPYRVKRRPRVKEAK